MVPGIMVKVDKLKMTSELKLNPKGRQHHMATCKSRRDCFGEVRNMIEPPTYHNDPGDWEEGAIYLNAGAHSHIRKVKWHSSFWLC